MMQYRFATPEDAALLAPLNQQLIRDEGHRNAMNLAQLAERMRGWLRGDYQAVLFEEGASPIGYALFRRESEYVYLRQLFVLPERRRQGVGRDALSGNPALPWRRRDRMTGSLSSHRCAARPSTSSYRSL
jgi:GNAT superfamily N-acetyltransferase